MMCRSELKADLGKTTFLVTHGRYDLQLPSDQEGFMSDT